MRRPDWDVRLVRKLSGLRGTEVEWGETDCVSLCLRALETMYPPDDLPAPRKTDRPTWTTKTGALRVLNREPPFHEVLKDHGCTEQKLTLAQNGDILVGLPALEEMPGYGVVAEMGAYHVDSGGRVAWTWLRRVRRDAAEDVYALRPPVG